MAVASYDVTRPAAAEGPANSSVPKQQRVGARRLLPRLEEVYTPWVYTPAATPHRKVVCQLAGWAGKWTDCFRCVLWTVLRQ